MRFFTKELWQGVNSSDLLLRASAEQKWKENGILYLNEFERVKKNLPRRFITEYLKRNGLHDYSVLGVFVIKRNHKYACEIQMINDGDTVILSMDDLRAFKLDINSFKECILGNLTWGYSEFEITSEGCIRLSILFDMQNEASFEFMSIKLSKQ